LCGKAELPLTLPKLTPRRSPWLYCVCSLALGVCIGLLLAWQLWTVVEYRLLPTEIVIKPPASNTTWCFPNTSLRGAEKVQRLLRGRLHPDHSALQADSQRVAEAVRQVNQESSIYRLWLLRTRGARYDILAQGTYELTLATEKGNFYLQPIPVRFVERYDSLARVRMEQ
jgi:hypothetical protein